MQELKRHISDFLAFVEDPSDKDKYELLEKHLLVIYSDGLKLHYSVEPTSEEPEHIQYKELRKKIEIRFQELRYYHTILNAHDISAAPELALGDAVDDLTDIIKDLKEIMSLTDNNTFLWQLQFSFNSHFKDHLVNLINYLNEFKR